MPSRYRQCKTVGLGRTYIHTYIHTLTNNRKLVDYVPDDLSKPPITTKCDNKKHALLIIISLFSFVSLRRKHTVFVYPGVSFRPNAVLIAVKLASLYSTPSP